MWYVFNIEGERCFAVSSELEAKNCLDDWFTYYRFIDDLAY